MTYKFDGFPGRALYELNGLPEEVRNGPLLNRLGLSCPVGVARADD